jgi:hypothetical protein
MQNEMKFYRINLPINRHDLIIIQDILRRKDVIRTVFPESQFDQYSFLSYAKEMTLHKTRFCAVLDRNIFSDIIAVINNNHKSVSETQKSACALLAFLQITDTRIEPGIAIYEHVDSGHYKYAEKELSLFRAADNVHPKYYVDIALGRSTVVPNDKLNYAENSDVKDMKGEDSFLWKLIYGITLKMAILETRGGRNFNKIKTLLKWIYTDYLFISPCIVFAIIYFSHKRFSKMIKNIGNSDIEKIRRGLYNATWDMRLVHYWSEKVLTQKGSNQIWLLCTEDKAIKEFSQYILSASDDESKIEAFFVKCLGEEDGKKIYDYYVALAKDEDNPQRAINSKPRSEEVIDAVIQKLEHELFVEQRNASYESLHCRSSGA